MTLNTYQSDPYFLHKNNISNVLSRSPAFVSGGQDRWWFSNKEMGPLLRKKDKLLSRDINVIFDDAEVGSEDVSSTPSPTEGRSETSPTTEPVSERQLLPHCDFPPSFALNM